MTIPASFTRALIAVFALIAITIAPQAQGMYCFFVHVCLTSPAHCCVALRKAAIRGDLPYTRPCNARLACMNFSHINMKQLEESALRYLHSLSFEKKFNQYLLCSSLRYVAHLTHSRPRSACYSNKFIRLHCSISDCKAASS